MTTTAASAAATAPCASRVGTSAAATATKAIAPAAVDNETHVRLEVQRRRLDPERGRRGHRDHRRGRPERRAEVAEAGAHDQLEHRLREQRRGESKAEQRQLEAPGEGAQVGLGGRWIGARGVPAKPGRCAVNRAEIPSIAAEATLMARAARADSLPASPASATAMTGP